MSSDFYSPDSILLRRVLEGIQATGVLRGSRNKSVAEKTGYTEGSVKRILSGHSKLTSRFITAVCGAYGIRREWVEEGHTPVLEPETAPSMELAFSLLDGKGIDPVRDRDLLFAAIEEMKARDITRHNTALTLAFSDMQVFLREHKVIMSNENKYLFRDIALLIQTLYDPYFDADLVRYAKKSAEEVLEIFNSDKSTKKGA
jgi:hypothetical protein